MAISVRRAGGGGGGGGGGSGFAVTATPVEIINGYGDGEQTATMQTFPPATPVFALGVTGDTVPRMLLTVDPDTGSQGFLFGTGEQDPYAGSAPYAYLGYDSGSRQIYIDSGGENGSVALRGMSGGVYVSGDTQLNSDLTVAGAVTAASLTVDGEEVTGGPDRTALHPTAQPTDIRHIAYGYSAVNIDVPILPQNYPLLASSTGADLWPSIVYGADGGAGITFGDGQGDPLTGGGPAGHISFSGDLYLSASGGAHLVFWDPYVINDLELSTADAKVKLRSADNTVYSLGVADGGGLTVDGVAVGGSSGGSTYLGTFKWGVD